MITLAVIVGTATVVAGLCAAFALRMLPTVRLQLGGLALVAVVLPLSAVLLSGLVMFHTGADTAVLAVSVAAATSALVGAFLVERSIVHRLERIRSASVILASGELGARAPTGGPSELAELSASFNNMAENLEQIFDARRQLVAWASHDLRGPVASLQAMLEAIEDGVVAPEHYLESLQGQVRFLAALVDDLFELACVDAGVIRLDFVSVDIGVLVASTVRRHDVEAQSKGVRLEVEVPHAGVEALCVPEKLERVLSNLIGNALRYTPVGGRIVVSVKSGAGAVFVSVEDNGVGIAPEAAERVFQPFWRADTARTPSTGSGLGLAIARALIEAQGGRIWVERPPNGGTRMCFVLSGSSTRAVEKGPQEDRVRLQLSVHASQAWRQSLDS